MPIIGAFTSEDVARLTGLSKRQIEYWDRTNVYSPSLAKGRGRQPYGRIYSFRDAVALRTLAKLRECVPLQQIRRVGEWLNEHYETPWASLRFLVVGRQIVFRDPSTSDFVATEPPGQRIIPFYLEEISAEVQDRISDLRTRNPDDIGRIQRHRFIAQNRYVIAGTRVPTEVIWDYHVAGYNASSIQREYPDLTVEDIKSAITFESNRLAS